MGELRKVLFAGWVVLSYPSHTSRLFAERSTNQVSLSPCNRSEFTSGNREWPDAAGQKWPREGVSSDQPKTVSTNGCPRRLECLGDNIW